MWISIIILLKFVPKDQNNNIPALVQLMAWRRPGDKPLSVSEPTMVSLLTHIFVTRPQWVNFIRRRLIISDILLNSMAFCGAMWCYSTRSTLTHWGRVTHICVGKLTIIGSDNGLSPCRRQAIIRTNAGILLIGTLGTRYSEILSEIHTFSCKKMHLKMSSGRWWPFCLGLNVLI